MVNTYTTGFQTRPKVATDALGNFVVTWMSGSPQDDILAQRFGASGARRGGEFRVGNPLASAFAIGMDPAGNFVVTWSAPGYTDPFDIFARRVNAAGVPVSTEFFVNTTTAGTQRNPAVAVDSTGDFAVVWNMDDGDQFGVFGQMFDSQGMKQGAEFRVNTVTTGYQGVPSIAAVGISEYVVVWESPAHDGSGSAVVGQRFFVVGIPIGAEFLVNTYTTGAQNRAVVTATPTGAFVVAWTSDAQDGSSAGAFAQRFDATGAARGSEFQVNTYTTLVQAPTSIGADPAGNFTIAWNSRPQDGSQYGVFGQRFGGLVPSALSVDTAGNGIFEPGETVDVLPSWRNVNGVAQTFSAALTSFTGPGGTYTIIDASGDYGTLANGAAARCTDCYEVSVSDPSMRPTHWDALAVESIVPDAQGQQKPWRLHVGDSFDDLPRTSGFYRFVETLLHHGVTAGCTPHEYCPSNSTTREQMAVFVLVAKEGAGYVPRACGATPMFSDVAFTSPFCRWIEELARRGVVNGCGGGNYCPSTAVTREQMAVFVLRTLDPALTPPACTTPVYNDVPASSPFCRWIEELTRRNVVTGCGGGNYCPTAVVTREQMGVFISATFGLLLYGP